MPCNTIGVHHSCSVHDEAGAVSVSSAICAVSVSSAHICEASCSNYQVVGQTVNISSNHGCCVHCVKHMNVLARDLPLAIKAGDGRIGKIISEAKYLRKLELTC